MPHRVKGKNRPRHHTHAVKPQSIASTFVMPPLPKTADEAAPAVVEAANKKPAKS